jgi:hypothetical protein
LLSQSYWQSSTGDIEALKNRWLDCMRSSSMHGLKKLSIGFLAIALILSSNTATASQPNAQKTTDGVLLTEDYFRYLKTQEMSFRALEKDIVMQDLERRIECKDESLIDFGDVALIFLGGIVIGFGTSFVVR